MTATPLKLLRRAPLVGACVVAMWALLPDLPASAGGWTQPEGGYYVKVWDRSLVSPGGGAAFDADGQIVDGLSGFQDHQLDLYAEYGLRDALTLVMFSTPVGYARYAGQGQAYMGPTGVGVRTRLHDGDLKLALQGQYSYAPPVGDDAVASELVDGVRVIYAPTVETHAVEGQLQAGYGLSWGWLTGSAGFRANTEAAVGHAVTGFAQLGVTKLRRFTFDLHMNLYQSLDAIELVNLAGAGRTSYLGIGLGAGFALTQRLAIVGAIEGVAYAKSNAATPSFQLGAEIKR